MSLLDVGHVRFAREVSGSVLASRKNIASTAWSSINSTHV